MHNAHSDLSMDRDKNNCTVP